MGWSSWLHLETVVLCCGSESGRKAARLQVLQVFLSRSPPMFPLPRPLSGNGNRQKVAFSRSDNLIAFQSRRRNKYLEIGHLWAATFPWNDTEEESFKLSASKETSQSGCFHRLQWEKHSSLNDHGLSPRKGTLLPFQSAFKITLFQDHLPNQFITR